MPPIIYPRTRQAPRTSKTAPTTQLTSALSGRKGDSRLARARTIVIVARFPMGFFRGGGEMTYRAICIALLLSCLPVMGCGTVSNLAHSRPGEGRVPFGGVNQDLACLQSAN